MHPLPASPLRRGPIPIEQHLAIALTTSLGFPAVWPSLKDGSANLSPGLEAKAARLREHASRHESLALDSAIQQASVDRAHRYMQGVKAYRAAPFRRDAPVIPVIWQQGTTRLLDYNPGAEKNAPVVLCVPSLINRFYILDLATDHSFLRHLAINGYRPLVVDWDAPGPEERFFSMEDYQTRRLIPLLDFVNRQYGAPHLLGYCMGGLMTLVLTLMQPEKVRTLTLLATPWDYHQPSPITSQLLQKLYHMLEPGMGPLGHIPSEVLQMLFSALQPMETMQKFVAFAGLDPQSQKARDFVLLEDWINDGVPLTLPLMRECVIDLYGKNVSGKNEWRVGQHHIDPRRLTLPVYICVPGRDNIVPPQSALPLANLISGAVLHEPMIGHIGMMASRGAPKDVWAPMRDFWKQH